MNAVVESVRDYVRGIPRAWDQFWFTPRDPTTLGAIRLCTGLMLFYTHLVWSFDLDAFFGPDGWLPRGLMESVHGDRFLWSYFWLIESPGLRWAIHIAALIIFAMLAAGLFSRVVSVLAYGMAVSYVNRVVPGAFFGLDKINCLLALYLMVGPSGACYSLDRYLARRRSAGPLAPVDPQIGANIAMRLIQVHMCIFYLFAGLDKLQGIHWWDGTAGWMAFANLEYQSFDMTWLAAWPGLLALITYLTTAWELSYCVLVWLPRWRPVVLLMAVLVHGGIALTLGLMTFGLAMLIGNMAFLPPTFVRAVVDRFPHGLGWAGQGRGVARATGERNV